MMLAVWIVICAFILRGEALDVVGGATNVDPEEYMPKVWQGANELNKNVTSNGNHLVPIKVLSATSQVVAGTKYVFKVAFGESNCTKAEVTEVSASQCQYVEGAPRQIYDIVLWEKPWMNFAEYSIQKERDVEPTETI